MKKSKRFFLVIPKISVFKATFFPRISDKMKRYKINEMRK